MPCPDFIGQMILTNSIVQEWQNNIPRLNLFSYYGTVIAIVQLRLKFTSITSLIYNSHQPLIPKTSHYLCNFTSCLLQGCIFLWRLKKEYRRGLLKFQSLILYCHELVLVIINNECVIQCVCVYFIKGITTLLIVRIPNKSCHRALFSLSYCFDECLLSWDFISAWCLCLCMKVCVKYQPAQCSYWEARQLHDRSLLSLCKHYVVAYEKKYQKPKKFQNEISVTGLAQDKKIPG